MNVFEKKSAKLRYRSHKRAMMTRNILVYALLVVISVVWLIPFVYLVLQSFATYYSPSSFAPMLPGPAADAANAPVFTGENYVTLFTSETYPFWRWWINSFVIALATMIIQTVLVLGTSYALSRLKFKSRKGIMKMILLLGMFPGFLSMVIIYFILKLLGIQQSIFSLILIYVASSAMNYYIAKGFFDTIPKSLDEAAMIDGANKNTVFFRIIMPLSKPIVVYTALISFTSPWGDFMMASYLSLGIRDQMTVAVGLQQMLSLANMQTYFPVFCAGGVLTSIPIMILFFWLQKYYVEGVTGGAVKG